MADDYLSASRIAKAIGVQVKHVSAFLEKEGWLVSAAGNGYALTESGLAKGAKEMSSPRFGKWIAWPAAIEAEVAAGLQSAAPPKSEPAKPQKPLTATAIGKEFGIPATRMNFILAELGWIDRSIKGWTITESGKAIGGLQKEDHRSGVPYVAWPQNILSNKSLRETAGNGSPSTEAEAPTIPAPSPASDVSNEARAVKEFRTKFEAGHRTTDGHYVRSRAEVMIDNWLYMAEIVHAYERKIPIEEDIYCDFYIPSRKVYIEFWGLENDPKYAARKAQKLAIYKKYNLKLIELADEDVASLDDVLPRKLLKFGVQAY